MSRLTACLKNRTYTTLLIGIILLTIMAAFIGCQKPANLKIGVVGTMTGPNSDLSVSGRRGVEMAVDEINQKGGIQGRIIELVVKDDENDPVVALKKDQEFIAEDIRLIIGHFTSGMVLSSMDYINSQDMLMLSPTISADSLSGMDDNFIRFIAPTKEQAKALVEVAQKLKQNHIAVLYDERNKGYTDQLVLNYQGLLKEKMGVEAKVYSYDSQMPETLGQALKAIEAEAPKGLFIVANAEDCARIAQGIKPAMPELQLYVPLWANTAELIRKGGVAVEGMMVVAGLDIGSESEKFKVFRQGYKERYGEETNFGSLYSYEAMMALAMAIEKAGGQQPMKIKNKLIEISMFEGVQDQYSIDSYGDNMRQYQVCIIHQGALRKVE